MNDRLFIIKYFCYLFLMLSLSEIYHMIVAYITGSISLVFCFAIIGLLINLAIKDKPFYLHLSNFKFIKDHKLNRYLGILYFKHLLANTFWKNFNPTLKIKEKPDQTKLKQLRNEMTYAEISHLIAFILVIVLTIISYFTQFHNKIIPILLIANVIFHLYPALVQQYNKRRLDKVIHKMNS